MSKGHFRRNSVPIAEDVNVLIGSALLVKCFEDSSDGVTLVGTLILNVIAARERDTKPVPIRVNNKPADESMVQVRNIKDTVFEPPKPSNENQDQKASEDFMKKQDDLYEQQMRGIREFVGCSGDMDPVGKCYTCDVRIPMIMKQVPFLSFPFKVFTAGLKLEFSTNSIETYFVGQNRVDDVKSEEALQASGVMKGIAHLRPSIADTRLGPRAFVVIQKESNLDQSKDYDIADPTPSIAIPKAEYGVKQAYYPKIELEWVIMGEIKKSLIVTYAPIVVLLVLQWINYFETLSDDSSNYFQNAITVVLALIVLIPAIREGRALTMNSVTFVDVMVLVFFIGTAFSAVPSSAPAVLGLAISTASLILPWYQTVDYFRFMKHERTKFGAKVKFEKKKNGEILEPGRVLARSQEVEYPMPRIRYKPVSTIVQEFFSKCWCCCCPFSKDNENESEQQDGNTHPPAAAATSSRPTEVSTNAQPLLFEP
eukprot:TRINITY_DN18766_c0_g1_i1.p1 TRINITY_DN18766_c0_g1~~TRINITY_DN18766_c0_g1_i1.p1  ORF type:complete len:482 (-),score=133.68 TRINITY_DN18766_c0_g1_i1:60-1505(-)